MTSIMNEVQGKLHPTNRKCLHEIRIEILTDRGWEETPDKSDDYLVRCMKEVNPKEMEASLETLVGLKIAQEQQREQQPPEHDTRHGPYFNHEKEYWLTPVEEDIEIDMGDLAVTA